VEITIITMTTRMIDKTSFRTEKEEGALFVRFLWRDFAFAFAFAFDLAFTFVIVLYYHIMTVMVKYNHE